MAFLDNSGDIILDAVLTDTGRLRLARGDGSFKITKFAFGDDEIDYSSYNGFHPSGSAYYDLEILQTPIFEAFTNNTSMMKSKLISLTNNNLLFLPIIKQNTKFASVELPAAANAVANGLNTVYVNKDTKDAIETQLSLIAGGLDAQNGFINGFTKTGLAGNYIRVDQGLDSNTISPNFSIDPELKETQYLVEVDSRLLTIYDLNNSTTAQEAFLDDDSIASYYFTQGAGTYIGELTAGTDNLPPGDELIQGPRGTRFRFGLQASLDAATSDYLFDTIGTDVGGNSLTFIDTNVRITGVTTGYVIDIPVRVVKKLST